MGQRRVLGGGVLIDRGRTGDLQALKDRRAEGSTVTFTVARSRWAPSETVTVRAWVWVVAVKAGVKTGLAIVASSSVPAPRGTCQL